MNVRLLTGKPSIRRDQKKRTIFEERDSEIGGKKIYGAISSNKTKRSGKRSRKGDEVNMEEEEGEEEEEEEFGDFI
jgi:hypothetical protein